MNKKIFCKIPKPLTDLFVNESNSAEKKEGIIMVNLILLILIVLIGLLVIYHQVEFKAFPPAGKFITIDNCKLHYITAGKGQPVVFLHGGMLSSRDFNAVIQLAAMQGYHAIAFDRPGYGYSERPKGVKVTPIYQARLIYRALKELGID